MVEVQRHQAALHRAVPVARRQPYLSPSIRQQAAKGRGGGYPPAVGRGGAPSHGDASRRAIPRPCWGEPNAQRSRRAEEKCRLADELGTTTRLAVKWKHPRP